MIFPSVLRVTVYCIRILKHRLIIYLLWRQAGSKLQLLRTSIPHLRDRWCSWFVTLAEGEKHIS